MVTSPTRHLPVCLCAAHAHARATAREHEACKIVMREYNTRPVERASQNSCMDLSVSPDDASPSIMVAYVTAVGRMPAWQRNTAMPQELEFRN